MSVARSGPAESDAAAWTVIRSHEILWRHWDEGEYLVYHTGSGDTHLLNVVSAAVLAELERRPLGIDQLTRRVADALAVEPDAELATEIRRLISAFDDVGLVEPAS